MLILLLFISSDFNFLLTCFLQDTICITYHFNDLLADMNIRDKKSEELLQRVSLSKGLPKGRLDSERVNVHPRHYTYLFILKNK